MSRTAKQDDFVTASQLAQMGVCERQIVYDHRFGRSRGRDQERAAVRGDDAHAAFHRQAIAAAPNVITSRPAKPWCFIASAVFSEDAITTLILRA